jgi:hypothetical protein
MPLLQHPSFTDVLSKVLQTRSKLNILRTGTNFVLFHTTVEAKPSYFQVRPKRVPGSWVPLPPPPAMKGFKGNEAIVMDYPSLRCPECQEQQREVGMPLVFVWYS